MAFVSGPALAGRGHAALASGLHCRNALLRPSRAVAIRPRRAALVVATLGDAVAQPEADVDEEAPKAEGAYDPSGMTVEEFFEKSLGEWRSQRSSHNLAWTQFEAITSDIEIVEKPTEDKAVKELCANNDVDPGDVVTSIEMSWEAESDWDDDDDAEPAEGCVLMSVVKDSPTTGRLLRSKGYAEEIPAVGTWVMTAEGAFVLKTAYDVAAAEERIWFATPDLRLRVSNIRTSSGRGVITSSFSSEIRRLKR